METVRSAPGQEGSAPIVKWTSLTRCKPSATIWRKNMGGECGKRRMKGWLSEKKDKYHKKEKRNARVLS